jgi:uncharacterized protein YbaR (Trm112 family)
MNTSCPMCRQQIVYCEPQRGENLLNCGKNKLQSGINTF